MAFNKEAIIQELLQWIDQEKELFYSECFSHNKIKLSSEKTNSQPMTTPFLKKAAPVLMPKPPVEKKADIAPTKPAIEESFNFTQIKKLIQKIDPQLAIHSVTLDDSLAKKIAHKWKFQIEDTPIVLLASLSHLTFLKRIAKAIEIYYFPCSVVTVGHFEKENAWDILLSSKELKLIIITKEDFKQLPSLKTHFKHIPHSNTDFLGKIPLFFLSDIDFYLKNPDQKSFLWKKLCQKIQTV